MCIFYYEDMNKVRQKSFRQGGLQILFGPRTREWAYDKEKLNFITPYILCSQMSNYGAILYRELLPKRPLVMWDMFGGIGTDSIEWSRYFNVITTEIDPQVYALLKQNIGTYHCRNVNIVRANCLTLLPFMKPDIIYFDPPWGENYKPKMKNFDFNQVYLDVPPQPHDQLPLPKKVSCADLIKYLYKKVTPNIVIKAPLNSNTFEQIFDEASIRYIFKSSPHNNLKFIYLSAPPSRSICGW